MGGTGNRFRMTPGCHPEQSVGSRSTALSITAVYLNFCKKEKQNVRHYSLTE